MRLWLKDGERRPDPAPVQTDERRPIVIGLVLWAAAAVVLLVSGRGEAWWIWMAVAGLAIGGLALVTVIRHRMAR